MGAHVSPDICFYILLAKITVAEVQQPVNCISCQAIKPPPRSPPSMHSFSWIPPFVSDSLFLQEATALLRRLPGLELVVRSVVPAIEDVVYMDNIANSILVGPNQMASLHSLLLEACRILDIEQVPDMYIRQVGVVGGVIVGPVP